MTVTFGWLDLDRPDLDWRWSDLPSRDSLTSLSFAAPALLWVLAIIPAIALVYLLVQRRRGRYAVRFTNVDLLANLVERTPGWRRHLPPILYVGALALLLASLARPPDGRPGAAGGSDGRPRYGHLRLDERR